MGFRSSRSQVTGEKCDTLCQPAAKRSASSAPLAAATLWLSGGLEATQAAALKPLISALRRTAQTHVSLDLASSRGPLAPEPSGRSG
ncbi:Hypothetical protein SMAX5B_001225 [Scophthalmus maximus]|uniref:Uncharacterized protein n=1 Tax=Scophthalmus maximus TaxID=52904 RepID=A0A2U9B9M2_SCOMX|nr:Hypothetical protein SMAX5B_001225 [Scophthalmus maximus]